MSLLWYDGLEGGLRGFVGATHDEWSSVNLGDIGISGADPRSGSYCLVFTGGGIGAITRILAPADNTFVLGFAIRPNSPPASGGLITQIREGATIHLSLEYNGSGQLVLKRGQAGTTLATGTVVLQTGGYSYINFKGSIDNATGDFEWEVDGVPDGSGSGVDTQNGGSAAWDRVGFGYPGVQTRYDDIYIMDRDGSAPYNDFLSYRVKIETLLAQAGNGSNTGLTTSTGSDHGALVDDALLFQDDDSTYNGSAVVGDKDTYNLSNMTLSSSTIYAVKPIVYAKKTDAAVRSVCLVTRHSGVDYDSADIAPTTSYKWLNQIYVENPGTSAAWVDEAEVNALEIGMKVTV